MYAARIVWKYQHIFYGPQQMEMEEDQAGWSR